MDYTTNIKNLIQYSAGGIVSKMIYRSDAMDVTLFCMAQGTEISEHTTTREAFIYVIKGEGVFYRSGEAIDMLSGVVITMAKDTKHSLRAKDNTSFILLLSNK